MTLENIIHHLLKRGIHRSFISWFQVRVDRGPDTVSQDGLIRESQSFVSCQWEVSKRFLIKLIQRNTMNRSALELMFEYVIFGALQCIVRVTI